MARKSLLSGRINLFVCPKQQKHARRLAKKQNITLSEYIRRLIAIEILKCKRNKIGLKLFLERERQVKLNLIAPAVNRLEQLKLSAIGSPFKSKS